MSSHLIQKQWNFKSHEELVAIEADLGSENPAYVHALLQAAKRVILGDHTGELERLLKMGVLPHWSDEEGVSLLSYAAKQRRPSALRAMLSVHPRANFFDANGLTPLMNAAFEGCSESIGVLLFHGADPTIKNGEGLTAVLLAHTEEGYSVASPEERQRCIEVIMAAAEAWEIKDAIKNTGQIVNNTGASKTVPRV